MFGVLEGISLDHSEYISRVMLDPQLIRCRIFDYWWDPHHNMIEHYADGDLVNQNTPVSWSAAGDENLAVWGPDVPKTFLQ